MKTKLTVRETVFISSMLFGMFFGAGNLIFPASLGTSAGKNILYAFPGLFITAVGLPLIAVISLGISRSDSLLAVSGRVGKKFGLLFSLILYLTIGPLFAIPRCASTSFAIGEGLLADSINPSIALAIFSFIFFAIVMFFTLHPGNIMTWIGKILNPLFLVLLAVLIVAALMNPIDSFTAVAPAAAYDGIGKAFSSGFIEGYNTLDALAGLAFGIVVVNSVRKTGISEPSDIASSTVKAGVFSCLFMGIIYFLLAMVTAQSASICAECTNGSEILAVIADNYFGAPGAVLLLAIVTVACLKTAVGLSTSCSEAFVEFFPNGPGYKVWAWIFVLVSFALANVGLTTIVAWCVPVLMFIYPIAIALILLAISGRLFDHSRTMYIAVMVPTVIAAFFDFCRTLASLLDPSRGLYSVLEQIGSASARVIPFSSIGLGWLVPAIIGAVIGAVLVTRKK